MSTRQNNGSQYENHQLAELHDGPAHAHRVAVSHHGEQDHQTGHEASRQALEHSEKPYLPTEDAHRHGTTSHGLVAFGHEDIAILAHQLWEARGCPEGSPEEDWSRAVAQLRFQNVGE